MGYAKIRYSSSDVHFFLQDEGIIPSLVQNVYGARKNLSKMESLKGDIVAITNCSYFNGNDTLGRNQGERYNGTLDQVALKTHWDYVIKKNGEHLIGAFNSWDHTDVLLGFTCAVVLIRDGEDRQDISTYLCGQDKYTNKNPNTFFGVLESGKSFMGVVEGRNSNDAGLSGQQIRSLVKKYYPTVKHLVMLDGGGSSEMIVDGKIVSYLSDKAERYMTNGIAFIKPNEPIQSNIRYEVVHGTYDTLDEANKEMNKLIALGFQAFVKEV